MTTILKRRPSAAHTRIAAVGGIAAVALAVAGCGGSSSGPNGSAYGGASATKAPASAPTPSAIPPSRGSGGATVALANSRLGEILVDSRGRTLYLWQADKGSTSTCTGECASVWPPLTVNGKPVAGAGISAARLATTTRSDGATEVTYNGHPLYTFAGDGAPGQTNGEGNQGFGAEWDVLSAAGNKV